MATPSSDTHDYWNSFYTGRASSAVPAEPTAFARWVQQELKPNQGLVELGFGNARDSIWFASSGRPVRGYDFAESAVSHAREQAAERGIDTQFAVLDLYDVAAVEAATAEVTIPSPAVYGRFLVHSLEESGRHNLLDFAAATLAEGGELYLEFRTGKDRDQNHLFGDDHFRIYLDPEQVIAEIEERGGSIIHSEQGHGFAVYKSEDPHVSRIVAKFSDR